MLDQRIDDLCAFAASFFKPKSKASSKRRAAPDVLFIEVLEERWLMSFSNWSKIGPAIALVPTTAGQIASTKVVNFGTTVYTGALNVKNTLDRIRANGTPLDANDGSVYTNPQASGLPVDGTYYEFVVKPSNGTDHAFTFSSPGPMRILLATGGDVFFTGDHYSTFTAVYIPGSATPTVSAFSDSPTSVVTGASTTFTATASENGGTISGVKIYRESNSTTGFQTTDTLVGSATNTSGTIWSLSAATTGLAAGTYTYYAVATDSTSKVSTAASTTLAVTAPKPTISAFSLNPTSVVTGASTTLSATATETGGTIANVKFYRETNSTSAFQTTDTLVGTGTASGSTYTLSTATTGFAAGTFTFYAVATDSASVSSAASSATLTVTSAVTPTPTISAFSLSPSSVTIGASTTLSATATETGGSISNVKFYRESNSTSGFQTTDTLVGTGTASGSTYSLSTSTTGFAAGTYTYYAVATDAASLTATSSATLTVNAASVSGAVLTWNVAGQTAFGTQGLRASTIDSSVTNSLGLTRGSGVVTTGTAASNAWGGTNFQSTSAAGISGNDFITFGLTVAAGQTASLSAIDLNYRRSSTGAASGLWQYQLNGGTWSTVGDFANEFSSTSSSGAAAATISLAGINGLQNLAAGSIVNFRLTPYGATSTGGTFYIYDINNKDLVVTASHGASAAVKAAASPSTFSSAAIAKPSWMASTNLTDSVDLLK